METGASLLRGFAVGFVVPRPLGAYGSSGKSGDNFERWRIAIVAYERSWLSWIAGRLLCLCPAVEQHAALALRHVVEVVTAIGSELACREE